MKYSILICLVSVFIFLFSIGKTDGRKFKKFVEYFDPDAPLEQLQGPAGRSSDARFRPSDSEMCGSCPQGVKCVPPIQCPAHVRSKHGHKPQQCRLSHNKWGYCCLTEHHHHPARPHKFGSKNKFRNGHLIREFMEEVKHMVDRMTVHSKHSLSKDNPDFFHHLIFQSPNANHRRDHKISKWALEQIIMGQLVREKEQMEPQEIFQTIDMMEDNTACLPIPTCKSVQQKYRTPDGMCNNPLPDRSFWGAAGQPMERLLPPAYEDAIWAPRIHSVDGSVLTGARTISRMIFPDFDRPHHILNLLFMQFGQFVSHDVTQSASMRNDDGQPIQCCTDDGARILPPQDRHFACMPMETEPDDEIYGPFRQGCLNFVRLTLAPYFNCRLGFGKQMSRVTHYLDSSGVYGSSLEDQAVLRLFQGGQLKLFPRVNGNMLPITTRNQSCGGTEDGKICYLSGDGRTNQIISLTLIHTMFAREHNRLASILAHINPHFSDEILFQEARRILIAEVQHIIYSEYLPMLIGRSAMHKFNLHPDKSGYTHDYDPDINPAIMNEFTGAAYRFGHSTVDGHLKVHTRKNGLENIEIPDVMFDPARLEEPGFVRSLTDTLLVQRMQQADHSVTRGLSGFMFRGSNPFGVDLVATNIQRGRDQGLRCYNDYLELIGQNRFESFEEFGPLGQRLQLVYKHPDDVDLWVGGLLENPFEDAVVGKLFTEIIGEQFSRFKRGDRYFHSHDPKINPGHFTPCQLAEIRKVTIARIICDNVQSMESIQQFAFLTSDFPGNEPVDCQSIPKMDFSCWKA